MRTVAACAASLVALLAAAPAIAEDSEGQSSWQLRQASAGGFLAHLKTKSRSNGGFLSHTTARPAAPSVGSTVLSTYEADIVRRMNSIRMARGLRPLRVSRQLSAAAAYHTNQMGLRGFFEHESANGSRFLEADRALLSLAPGPLVVGRREHPLGLARDLRCVGSSRVDAEPAAPRQHPVAGVARSGPRRSALRLRAGRVPRWAGHDRDRRLRRQNLAPSLIQSAVLFTSARL